MRVYKTQVRLHLKPKLGALKLVDITAPKVAAFRDELLGSMSRPNARKVLTSLKAILREAQSRGLLTINPAAAVSIFVGGRHQKQVVIPSRDDVKRMFAELEQRAEGRRTTAEGEVVKCDAKAWRRYKALILTAALSGLRASELRGLPKTGIDFKGGTITVATRADEDGIVGPTKTERSRRTVEIPERLVKVLREWIVEAPPGELVFANGKGNAESHANIYNRAWAPLMADLGMDYNFHTMRHFYASSIIAAGATPLEVMKLMGHSTINVTFSLYGHLFPEDTTERRARADRIAGGLF